MYFLAAKNVTRQHLVKSFDIITTAAMDLLGESYYLGVPGSNQILSFGQAELALGSIPEHVVLLFYYPVVINQNLDKSWLQ